MAFTINFSEEKNQLLKATRGIGFDDVLKAMEHDRLLADIGHPNLQHSKQRMYVIRIDKYAYAIPYVVDHKKDKIFLKTIYPSRVLTKKYVKGDNHD